MFKTFSCHQNFNPDTIRLCQTHADAICDSAGKIKPEPVRTKRGEFFRAFFYIGLGKQWKLDCHCLFIANVCLCLDTVAIGKTRTLLFGRQSSIVPMIGYSDLPSWSRKIALDPLNWKLVLIIYFSHFISELLAFKEEKLVWKTSETGIFYLLASLHLLKIISLWQHKIHQKVVTWDSFENLRAWRIQ